MKSKKRNILIVAVVLCVCAAAYLNWSYNHRASDESAFSSDSITEKDAEETSAETDTGDYLSEYFAQARLTRQQSRDEAKSILEQAAKSDTASKDTIDGAVNSIAAMANYSMEETQIENLILAKNFSDCVAFMSDDGVTIAVPAPEEGLSAEDVAKITDCIVSETDYKASQLKIIEVKPPQGGETTAQPTASASPSPAAASDENVD